MPGMKEYVVFEQMPEAKPAAGEAFTAKWDRIMAIRDDVKKVLEQARADKLIGSSLEAALTLYCNEDVYAFLNAIPMDELADLFIVSQVRLEQGEGGVKGVVDGLGVQAEHAAGADLQAGQRHGEQHVVVFGRKDLGLHAEHRQNKAEGRRNESAHSQGHPAKAQPAQRADQAVGHGAKEEHHHAPHIEEGQGH